MAGLRRLLDDPVVLADGASASASLARPRALPVPRAGPGLAGYVGRHRRAHRTVAQRGIVFDSLELAPSTPTVCRRYLSLFPRRSPFHPRATRRPPRSSARG